MGRRQIWALAVVMSFSTRLEEGQMAKKPNMTAFGFVTLGERQLYIPEADCRKVKEKSWQRYASMGKFSPQFSERVTERFNLENAQPQNSTCLSKYKHIMDGTQPPCHATRESSQGLQHAPCPENSSGLNHLG